MKVKTLLSWLNKNLTPRQYIPLILDWKAHDHINLIFNQSLFQ
jgi:hypothetical protein